MPECRDIGVLHNESPACQACLSSPCPDCPCLARWMHSDSHAAAAEWQVYRQATILSLAHPHLSPFAC